MADKEYDKLRTDLAKSGHVVPLERFAEPEMADQESAEEKSGDGGAKAADIDESKSEHGYHGKLMTREELQKKLGAGPSENKALDAEAAAAVTPQPVRMTAAARKSTRK